MYEDHDANNTEYELVNEFQRAGEARGQLDDAARRRDESQRAKGIDAWQELRARPQRRFAHHA